MNTIIIFFLLPALIIFLARQFFAFYYPLNLGIYSSSYAHHAPYDADHETIRIFFIVNSLLFVFSFLLFSALFFLPAISYLYNLPFLLEYFPIISKLLIIFYIIWFLSLTAAGYIFGNTFYDAFENLKIKGTFYFNNLSESYRALKDSPGNTWSSIQCIFDNEKKSIARWEVHKAVAKDYAHEHNDKQKAILKEVFKLDKSRLAELKDSRKKHGHIGVLLHNIKYSGSTIVYFPFMPALMFYLITIDFLISIFSSEKEAETTPKS
jgi:hypothetical protein